MDGDVPVAARALRIEPATADHLRALLAGGDVFRDVYQLQVIDGYIEFDGVLERSLRQVTDSGADPVWLTHLFVAVDDQALIGLGGFKGPPHLGTVEIGYGIAPSYRGRGYATAAARALLDRAKAAAVSVVIAHTLAEPNASTRVLQRLGFRQIVVVEYPGVGATWRWERRLDA